MAKKAKKSKKVRKSKKGKKKKVGGARAKKKTAKKAVKKRARRTTMYSRGGKKLYAVRDASGKFKDIQTYKRAHSMDIKRHAADEE